MRPDPSAEPIPFTEPDLSVVIVSWNVQRLLRHCLNSVVGSLELPTGENAVTAEIIVVDNGSTDGSADMVRTEFPQVTLIANPDNRGFTVGNNQGIRASNGRYLLLLNPDAEVVADALSTLIAFMDAHPEVGLVGPQLLYPNGQVQSSRRRFPTLTTLFFESTWLQSLAPRASLHRFYFLDQPEDSVLDVDWIVGAAMLARRETVENVGDLDEGFFMYSEELDWCRRP